MHLAPKSFRALSVFAVGIFVLAAPSAPLAGSARNAQVAEYVQAARAAAASAQAAADEARAAADAARGEVPAITPPSLAAPEVVEEVIPKPSASQALMKAGVPMESAVAVPEAEVVANPAAAGAVQFEEVSSPPLQ